MFVGISVKNIFKSKWTYVCVGVLALVGIFSLNSKIQHISLGKRITAGDVLSMTPYYAEYDLTVVSNKNVNTYFVKEEIFPEVHTFKYLDSLGHTTEVSINENTVTIKNDGQKNTLAFDTTSVSESKLSYSSIAKVYASVKEHKNTCDCSFEMYEKEDKFNVYLLACGKAEDENCINTLLGDSHFYEIQLELDKKTGIPCTMYVLGKDKSVINCIVYTKFENKE